MNVKLVGLFQNIIKIKNKNKGLIYYGLWNILDKGFVFLLPILVLKLFNASEEYIQLEYIISIVTLVATFFDGGLNSYMFYFYQKAKDKRNALIISQKINAFFYSILLFTGLLLILFDFFIIEINDFLIFIVFRCLFIYFSKYLISYYRLKDKPTNAIYFSLSVNFLTAFVLLFYYLNKEVFNLYYYFGPQIIAIFLTSFFVLKSFKKLQKIKIKFWNYIKNSFLFSWPMIIQAALMMYLANYGKIYALDNLTENEGVILGLTTRLSIIIQLAHGTFIGYYAKKILINENFLIIQKSLLIQYLIILFSCFAIVVILITTINYTFNFELHNLLIIQSLLILYTLFWCIFSYFELYFQRINKNIYKLYFVIVNVILFSGLIIMLPYEFLLKFSISLFLSTAIVLIINFFTLKKLSFKFI